VNIGVGNIRIISRLPLEIVCIAELRDGVDLIANSPSSVLITATTAMSGRVNRRGHVRMRGKIQRVRYVICFANHHGRCSVYMEVSHAYVFQCAGH
jgi:hypothetical protein